MWVWGQNAGGSVWRTSSLALSLFIALVFLVVQADLLQGAYSHTEKHMRGLRMRHKIGNREGRAFVRLLFAQVNMLGKSREQE